MKRRDLLAYLRHQGCMVLREGAKHTIVYNPVNDKASTIPRHRDIDDSLVRKLFWDLGIRLLE